MSRSVGSPVAIPAKRKSVASVMISGLTSVLATTAPLKAPAPMPVASAITTAIPIGAPATNDRPSTIEARPMIDTPEMSIPPVMMMSVRPMAAMITWAKSLVENSRFSRLRNAGLIRPSTTSSSTSTTASMNSQLLTTVAAFIARPPWAAMRRPDPARRGAISAARVGELAIPDGATDEVVEHDHGEQHRAGNRVVPGTRAP